MDERCLVEIYGMDMVKEHRYIKDKGNHEFISIINLD